MDKNYIEWKVQVKTKHGLELKMPLHNNALAILHRYIGKNKRFVFDVLPERFNVEDDKALVPSAASSATIRLLPSRKPMPIFSREVPKSTLKDV